MSLGIAVSNLTRLSNVEKEKCYKPGLIFYFKLFS